METELLQYESASANLSVLSPKVAVLGSLVARDRRKGHATELLRQLCERADAQGLELKLTAGSDGGPDDLDTEALIRFYGCFGFSAIRADNPYWLGRQPSAQL